MPQFICGGAIAVSSANLSGEKRYATIHKSFKTCHNWPKEVEEKIFSDKQQIHRIFLKTKSQKIFDTKMSINNQNSCQSSFE